jgi:hypothetical protein
MFPPAARGENEDQTSFPRREEYRRTRGGGT